MDRATLWMIAAIVLAYLYAPPAMHAVDQQDREQVAVYAGDGGQCDHEHPIVASSARRVRILTRPALAMPRVAFATPATRTARPRDRSSVFASAAHLMTEDGRLQPLLSTYRI